MSTRRKDSKIEIGSKVDIPTFDLTNVTQKALQQWPDILSESNIENTIFEYRKFLADCKSTPGDKHEPRSVAVDAMWHQHILFTKKYNQDCTRYFGYYLHHRPHVGKSAGCDRDCSAVSS